MSAPDKELLDLTAKLIFNISYDDCGVKLRTVIKRRSEALAAYVDQAEKLASIQGMNSARAVVLRRTEVPADAKNPTRDFIVLLGEEIADLIDLRIADMQQEAAHA